MHIRMTLTVDNPETAQCLNNLANRSHLSTFVKIAVESYLATEEGKKIYGVLGGPATEGSRRNRRKKVTAESSDQAPVPVVKHESQTSTREPAPQAGQDASPGSEVHEEKFYHGAPPAPADVLAKIFSSGSGK